MRLFVVLLDPEWNDCGAVAGVYDVRSEAESVAAEARRHRRCYGAEVVEVELGVARNLDDLLG